MTSKGAFYAAADVVGLIVFTVVGLINHKDGITARGVAEVLGPIVIVGAAAAAVFGTYTRPGLKTLLPAWAIAVPVGILIRKALWHEPATWRSTAIFVGVALVFSLLFVVAARAIVWVTLVRSR